MVFTMLLSFHRTQHEEWDLTLRLLLVIVVGRIHLNHLLPEARLLLRICHFGLNLHLTVSDLDRRFRVGPQVQVPRGVCRRAALRGYNYEIFTVHDVE